MMGEQRKKLEVVFDSRDLYKQEIEQGLSEVIVGRLVFWFFNGQGWIQFQFEQEIPIRNQQDGSIIEKAKEVTERNIWRSFMDVLKKGIIAIETEGSEEEHDIFAIAAEPLDVSI